MSFALLEVLAESIRTRVENFHRSKSLVSVGKTTAAHRWWVRSSENRPTTAGPAKLHDRGWKMDSTSRVVVQGEEAEARLITYPTYKRYLVVLDRSRNLLASPVEDLDPAGD